MTTTKEIRVNRRTLRLNREPLTALDTDQLAAIAGGASVPVVGCEIQVTKLCVSQYYSCINCITHPPCITDVTTD